MTAHHIVRITNYVTDAASAEANGMAPIKALGEPRVPTTAIVVQTLDPEWLVEIEAVAVACKARRRFRQIASRWST